MAESAGEKTEMPTPKKLRDARQKGQVCTSKDITSTAILIVLFALLAWMGVALMEDMEGLLRFLSGRISENNAEALGESSKLAVLLIFKHSFIFVAVAAVIGFWAATFSPLALSNRPSEAAVIPLPSPDTTPPVTKIYFVMELSLLQTRQWR